MQNKIRVTGLTGSIGTGKSTAASLFKEKGIPVIDADELSREAVSGGSAALHEIAEEFGREYVTEDGELDRKRLAGLVFTDEGARRRLDEIVHPRVIERFMSLRDEYEAEGYEEVIFDCPLLIEEGLDYLVDRVLLVTAREDIQIERIMKRDVCTSEEAKRRIASQMPQEDKKKRADIIIDNSGSLDDLKVRINDIAYAGAKK